MAKTFDEYIRERRATHGPEGREAERIFRAAYAFGQVIYSARKSRNLRQSDLAELSGIAQADISRIERGMIAPTIPTLLKLADALDAQIQFVLPAGDGASTDATGEYEVSPSTLSARSTRSDRFPPGPKRSITCQMR